MVKKESDWADVLHYNILMDSLHGQLFVYVRIVRDTPCIQRIINIRMGTISGVQFMAYN